MILFFINCAMNFSKYMLSIFALLFLLGSNSLAQNRFAFIGDFGTADSNEAAVADLINSWQPDFIVTLGDNSYDSRPIDSNIGQFFGDFIGNYTGSLAAGCDTNRFFPCIGNHDWYDGGGIEAYLEYFTLPGANVQTTGTSGNERYYDFIIGDIHFFCINSYYLEPDGYYPGSVQAEWCEEQMELSDSKWKIIFFHHPPYSSSIQHGSTTALRWDFEEWGADAVLSGHVHSYERVMRDDNNDNDTIPYIVNGIGGRYIYDFPDSGFVEGSAFRYNDNFGAMLAYTTDSSLTFEFYSIDDGGRLHDSLTLIRYDESCCVGMRGNIDSSPDDDINISDLLYLVEYIFIPGSPAPECFEEANIDGVGPEVPDISDLLHLVDYLFILDSPPPADCQNEHR